MLKVLHIYCAILLNRKTYYIVNILTCLQTQVYGKHQNAYVNAIGNVTDKTQMYLHSLTLTLSSFLTSCLKIFA